MRIYEARLGKDETFEVYGNRLKYYLCMRLKSVHFLTGGKEFIIASQLLESLPKGLRAQLCVNVDGKL